MNHKKWQLKDHPAFNGTHMASRSNTMATLNEDDGQEASGFTSATAPRCGTSTGTAQYADMAEVVPTLPLETRCPPFPLRQLGGFCLPEYVVRNGIPAAQALFAPRNTDILLASFPKSGTTWFKALAFATLRRTAHPPSEANHPFRHRNPHDCVGFVEMGLAVADDVAAVAADLEALPAPRVLATHLPYSLLPEGVVSDSGCRIVYVCRDPKDALVSSWLFTRKVSSNFGIDAESFQLQEALELFCAGRYFGGPQWRHVLEYWEDSQRRPGKVLFLRYEEMLRDPVASLKKMAEFTGCPFTVEEEERGVARAIAELCSIGKLRNMEVNRSGRTQLGVNGDAFFRKGVAGDWSSHMTPEVGEKLDKVVDDALQGSGFTFATNQ